MRAAVAIIAILCAAYAGGLAQEQTLPETLALKARIYQLEQELFQTQEVFARCEAGRANIKTQLDSVLLTSEAQRLASQRSELERALLEAFGGADGDSVDWSTSPPSLKRKAGAEEPK